MQTFLPYADFEKTAKCLDMKRLNKQRLEANQIINILLGIQKGNGWKNHPAVKMWKGHVSALMMYFNDISKEWVRRGYKHNMGFYNLDLMVPISFPKWLGNKEFHLSHQSNLLRKLPDHYRIFFPEVRDDLPYIWPI